jgi:hypothetical protein
VSKHPEVDKCLRGLIDSGNFKNMTHCRAAALNNPGALEDYQKEYDEGCYESDLNRRCFDVLIPEENGILWLVGFHFDK